VAELAASVTGSVAVVVPVGRRAETEGALAGSTAAGAAADRLRVLEPWDTKGLEFDGVIVVDPDDLVAESESGWRTLYVVLTRATSRVVTVGRTDRWREQVDARR
jgi:UvrD-like helicase C-terminal domain